MEEVKDTIFEEREEELMISSTDDSYQFLRKAHFLKPTMDESLKKLPPSPLSMSSNTRLKLKFPQMKCCAWRLKNLEWNKWVEAMQIRHQHTWKKCGIFEAVLCSKITIRKKMDLVFGVADKWCRETNTFVFPWGEATVTLEDMLVLGGFSVLGDSVLAPLKNQEMRNTEASLFRCFDEIRSKTGSYPKPNQWIKYFVSKHGSEVEHEAFLCLWLSKYVFPNIKSDCIDKTVFPAAIRLARGIRIALAQPVLACIYRDLGTMKDRIVNSEKHMLKLCAQLHLVQVWVWERFTSLSPEPLLIKNDEPRLAKWHCLKNTKLVNVGLLLDSESDHFKWRPYVSKMEPCFIKFYRENEGWVVNGVGSAMDSTVESFARCVRVSKLDGLDCSEQYLPHRVSMQFGLDQDVPDQYDLSRFYIKPNHDEKVFIPSRLFKADVTKRYFDWWRSSKPVKPYDALAKPVQRKKRTLSKCTSCAKKLKQADVAAANDDDVKPFIGNHSLNSEKIHVGPLLDGAPGIPLPCNTHDFMELGENHVNVVQVQRSETTVIDSEVAAVTEVETQDSCFQARAQREEEVEELETLQTQKLQDVAAVNILLSSDINESEKATIEPRVQVESLEEVAVKGINENGKEIEVIDLESFNLEDSSGYKIFTKSREELIARISKIEQIVDAATRLKAKGKYHKKA